MSEEAIDLARAAFEQFSRGDFSAYADLPDEFELVLAPEMPDAGTYRGAAAREWMTAWVNSFDRLTQEPIEFIDVGDDQVLVEFPQRGWTAGSDVPVESSTPSRDTGQAMSEENVEIVRSVLEPFAGINVAEVDWGTEALGEMLGRAYSPDIELRTLEIPLGLDIGDSYHGLDGLVEYLRAWLEPFSDYHVENLDYIEAGDCVLVPTRQWGVGRGSGTRTEIELTALYELRDGKIARIHQFDTLDEALEAAGLSE